MALEYSPRFVEAWVNLGYVELRRGNFEQARRDFVRARSLNHDIPAPHHALGSSRTLQGDGVTPRSATGLRSPSTRASRRRGRTSRDASSTRGQYENAREQFQRLREVAPRAAEGWAGEAESLLQLDREAEAEGVVEQARSGARRRAGAGARAARACGSRRATGTRPRRRSRRWSAATDRDATGGGLGLDRRRARGQGRSRGARAAAAWALAIDRDEPVARYALALVATAPQR